MRGPSAKYLYGLTSTFGTSVNVSQAEIDAVDAEARANAQDRPRRSQKARLRRLRRLPIIDVALVPVEPDPVGPVVEVELVPLDDDDATDGDACSSACGYCGRCSDGPRGNATCSDCGADFFKGREDVGRLCDACCSQRDAHADALEIRMAKVDLPTRVRKDVA